MLFPHFIFLTLREILFKFSNVETFFSPLQNCPSIMALGLCFTQWFGMSLKFIKTNMCFFPIAHLDFSFPLSYQSVNNFFSKREVNRGSDGKTSANLRISGIASLKRRLIQCKISFLSSPRGSQVSEESCRNPYFLSSLTSHNHPTLKGSCWE